MTLSPGLLSSRWTPYHRYPARSGLMQKGRGHPGKLGWVCWRHVLCPLLHSPGWYCQRGLAYPTGCKGHPVTLSGAIFAPKVGLALGNQHVLVGPSPAYGLPGGGLSGGGQDGLVACVPVAHTLPARHLAPRRSLAKEEGMQGRGACARLPRCGQRAPQGSARN